MKINLNNWMGLLKLGVFDIICISLLFMGCSSSIGEPEKKYEKGTTSYARHNEAKMIGTCGLHGTVIDEWQYEGHKYLIVGATQIIHSNSCPCQSKN